MLYEEAVQGVIKNLFRFYFKNQFKFQNPTNVSPYVKLYIDAVIPKQELHEQRKDIYQAVINAVPHFTILLDMIHKLEAAYFAKENQGKNGILFNNASFTEVWNDMIDEMTLDDYDFYLGYQNIIQSFAFNVIKAELEEIAKSQSIDITQAKRDAMQQEKQAIEDRLILANTTRTNRDKKLRNEEGTGSTPTKNVRIDTTGYISCDAFFEREKSIFEAAFAFYRQSGEDYSKNRIMDYVNDTLKRAKKTELVETRTTWLEKKYQAWLEHQTQEEARRASLVGVGQASSPHTLMNTNRHRVLIEEVEEVEEVGEEAKAEPEAVAACQ